MESISSLIGIFTFILSLGSYSFKATRWYVDKKEDSPGKRSSYLQNLKDRNKDFRTFMKSINPNTKDPIAIFAGMIFPYGVVIVLTLEFMYLPYVTYVGNLILYFIGFLLGVPTITFLFLLSLRIAIPYVLARGNFDYGKKIFVLTHLLVSTTETAM